MNKACIFFQQTVKGQTGHIRRDKFVKLLGSMYSLLLQIDSLYVIWNYLGNKMASIQDLKELPSPQSPRKCSKKLTCAVLNKSLLRPTQNGEMFSLNLCDKDPSSTIKAVCFNGNMSHKFEPSKTYELQDYKLKKGFGSSK